VSIGCPSITKAKIAIQMTQIYQYQPNTQTEYDFHAYYLKKISQQIFQYSKSTKT
jgi:predicted RNA methylase